jgi:hypothetical protein
LPVGADQPVDPSPEDMTAALPARAGSGGQVAAPGDPQADPAGPATGGPPPPGDEPAAPRPDAGGPPPAPPGIREQVNRTIAAGRRLVDAHVTLARAELDVIRADLTRVAVQVGMALGMFLFVGLLVPVGMTLFLGEWIFGSMGWGILHGTLFAIGMAVILVLGALRISRSYLAGTFLVAILVGIAVGIVLGFAWPNIAYARIGEAVVPGVDAGVRPLVVGLAVGALVLGLLGLLGGARAGGGSGAIGGLIAGAIGGAIVGAFTAISFSTQVGAALGVATALVTWPVLAALALRGYDGEEFKRRFTPQRSIDAARETMDFLKQRLPGKKEDEA